jgi:RNA polymerase II transcription elongation factor
MWADTDNSLTATTPEALLIIIPVSLDNHKPNQTSPSRTTVITPSTTAGTYSLTMTDDDDGEKPSRYEYVGGRSSTSSSAYALIYDSAKEGFILDKVDSNFNFNLTSTPWEGDSQKLEQQYPQLSLKDEDPDSGEDSLFSDDDGELDEDGKPQEKNPYDFRHFLNKRRTSSLESIEYVQQEVSASKISTPIQTATHRPAATSTNRKPASKPRTKPAPPPQKPAPSPPRDSSDLSSPVDVSSPEAIIEAADFEDREAPDDSSDQEDQEVKYTGLTIEMDSDDDTKQKPRLGRRSPLFPSGALSARLTSAAPISLSAASSVSPASRRGSPGREGLGISFARPRHDSSDSESDVDNDENDQGQSAVAAAGAADSDVDRDGDVLMLPSPVVQGSHHDQASAPTPTPGIDEDADELRDLEAELEQAFESADMEVEEEGAPQGVPISLGSYATNRTLRAEENESESEEE